MLVKCMLCNLEFDFINNTHLGTHNLSVDEYEEMFPNAPMVSDDYRKRQSVRMLEAVPQISKAQIGRVPSVETIRRLSEAMTGRTHTPAAIRRMSEAQTVRFEQSGGMSEESKQKNREAHIGKTHSAETKRLMSKSHNGEVMSNESLQLMSESRKELWKTSEYQINQAVARQRKPNISEEQLQSILNKYYPGEWKYVGDYSTWIEGRNPDFLNVNSKKQVIEMFGVWWHTEAEIEPLIAHYRRHGFDCLIIWEYDVYDEDTVVQLIEAWKKEVH